VTDVNLRRMALRWGSVGVLSGIVATAVAVVQSFPLLLLGMVLFGVPLMIVPLMVGLTDTRLDTTAGATRIGFDAGDPGDYEASRVLPIPNTVQVACWLGGVGVVGVALMAVAA
jgi:hypothetical protein